MRSQFTDSPTRQLTAMISGPAGKDAPPPRPASREVRYAEIPLLNSDQLVLTFHQPVSSKLQWASQTVDVGVRDKGVYLVEAVQGEYRAYTILMVSDLVLTTKTGRGRVFNFVADRATGEPIEGAEAVIADPAMLGGTRHLSAVQFVQDQHDAAALVASQDGRFTIFAWSPCERMVHGHRVETLLL